MNFGETGAVISSAEWPLSRSRHGKCCLNFSEDLQAASTKHHLKPQ
jgi:hypothetical protein